MARDASYTEYTDQSHSGNETAGALATECGYKFVAENKQVFVLVYEHINCILSKLRHELSLFAGPAVKERLADNTVLVGKSNRARSDNTGLGT